MNSNGLAPPHIPQALLHTLLQAPALLAALRSMIAGAGAPTSASETPPPLSALCPRHFGCSLLTPSGCSKCQFSGHAFLRYYARLFLHANIGHMSCTLSAFTSRLSCLHRGDRPLHTLWDLIS